MAIDERLLDCDTQPEIEENFNRILNMQESKAGSNVWITRAMFWGLQDKLVTTRVISRQSELPAAFMADFGGTAEFYGILAPQGVQKITDYDASEYVYVDDDNNVHTLPVGYITDVLYVDIKNGDNHIYSYIDLNTNYVIYSQNPLEDA